MITLRPYQTEGLTAICTVAWCNSKIYCKQMCYKHYRRNVKNGNPLKLSDYENNRLIAKQKWDEAKKQKLKFYFTDIPCSRGHISRKFTRGARCEACYLEDLKNYDRARTYALQANYKISKEKYQEMFQAQNGVCAICHQPETRIVKGKLSILSVDHCHDTKKIRGLLCNACNTGIGYLKHNSKFLRNAALYCEEIK